MKKLMTLFSVFVFLLIGMGFASAASVTIVNYSFELPALVDGNFNYTADGWFLSGGGSGGV